MPLPESKTKKNETPTPEVEQPVSAPLPAPTPTPAGMLVADAYCTIDVGHVVPVKDVTPAEVLVLTADFQTLAKGKPISRIKQTGTVDRTNSQEVARLCRKYGTYKVLKLFPGALPNLPTTFEEAETLGMRTSIPVSKLGSFAFGDPIAH